MEDLEDLTSVFSIEEDGSLLVLSSNARNGDKSGRTLNATSTPWETPFTTGIASPLTVEMKPVTAIGDHQRLQGKEDSQGGTIDLMDDSGAADVSLQEIQEILAKEQENLEMLRHANEVMKSLLNDSFSGSFHHGRSKPGTNDPASNTSNLDVSITEETTPEGDLGDLTKENVVDLKTANVASSSQSPFSTKLGKSSSNLRRRRQLARLNPASTNAFNVQTFIQDYYRSLDTVSRYIIAASILSFLTAFLLLSWYSAQTHSHDMEIFKLKEKQVIAAQEALEKFQLHKENLTEAMIHQRFEESKKCQSLLQSCHSKRDDLQAQIAKQSQDGGKYQIKLEAKLESQRKEIQALQEKLNDLQGQNMELRKEIGQSFSSSWAKFIFAFLNVCMNRSVQIAFGVFLTSVILLFMLSAFFSK